MKLKFRIWDKKYHMFDCNESPDLFISTDGEVYEKDERSYAMQTWIEYNKVDYYEVNQYTGLKDKNGREIYEGDIVEGHTFDEHIDKKQIGSIEYNEGRHGFVFVPFEFKSKNLYYPLFAIVTCEVIGNIYQNKELLDE
jgi:uncharacterized phage protein (TIGR01671 family)